MSHKFGGIWTLIKLDALKRYLEAFNIALQGKPKPEYPFRRIYIDAFAGTGECDIKLNSNIVNAEGSVQIALQIEPPFDDYYFIEQKKTHIDVLNNLTDQYEGKNIKIYQGDGNQKLYEIITSINWKSSRAVLFLDPYGMSVEWNTLEYISKTQSIDIWYLFPISAVYRQAAHDYNKIDDNKRKALTRLFGTTEWFNEFYKAKPQRDLFNNNEDSFHRISNNSDILLFMEKRLKSIFPVVLKPIVLSNAGVPLFALYFCSSNPSPKAISLTKRIAGYLISMNNEGKLLTELEEKIAQEIAKDYESLF